MKTRLNVFYFSFITLLCLNSVLIFLNSEEMLLYQFVFWKGNFILNDSAGVKQRIDLRFSETYVKSQVELFFSTFYILQHLNKLVRLFFMWDGLRGFLRVRDGWRRRLGLKRRNICLSSIVMKCQWGFSRKPLWHTLLLQFFFTGKSMSQACVYVSLDMTEVSI